MNAGIFGIEPQGFPVPSPLLGRPTTSIPTPLGSTFVNVRAIPSLYVWLDASDTSSITLNRGNVSQWRDLSGNGLHLAQSTASAQPRYALSAVAGKNVVRFGGAQFVGASAASDWTFMMDGTLYTVFCVARVSDQETHRSQTQQSMFILNTSNSGNEASVGITWFVLPGSNVLLYTMQSGSFLVARATRRSFVGNQWNVFSVRCDRTNSLISNRVQMAQNMHRPSVATSNSATAAAVAPQFPLLIGSGSSPTPYHPLVGDVAELLIYTGAMSDDSRAAVERHLMTKWGLVG